MRKTLTSLLAGAALVTVAGSAGAQPYGGIFPPYGGNSYGGDQDAVLYELPGFQGRSTVVHIQSGNLSNENFNDRARSIRMTGTWRLCEDASFRGHCETVSGSIPDLHARGIDGLSSLQQIGWDNDGYPGGYPGYPGGYPGSAVQGRSVVFYPGPVRNSSRPPWGYGGGNAYGYGVNRRAADDFCRSMGNRESVYYDNSGGVLQDVLCRR